MLKTAAAATTDSSSGSGEDGANLQRAVAAESSKREDVWLTRFRERQAKAEAEKARKEAAAAEAEAERIRRLEEAGFGPSQE
eukprot:11781434-Alexandrium_andersonii.AAC.1